MVAYTCNSKLKRMRQGDHEFHFLAQFENQEGGGEGLETEETETDLS